MRLQTENGIIHLTYCLNIHPGETFAEVKKAILLHAAEIARNVAVDKPFGLGLRLGKTAVEELKNNPDSILELKKIISDNNMYVFTVNAFPYGTFHNQHVGTNVYAPDWREQARVDYTVAVAEILVELLEDGVEGSISTVPGGYGSWFSNAADEQDAVNGILKVATELERIHRQTGKKITLAVEPEPDCLWDTCADCQRLLDMVNSDYVGICWDLCHQAVIADPVTDGLKKLIPNVAKVQISSALSGRCTPDNIKAFNNFKDEIYLHQSSVKTGTDFKRFPDLPPALDYAEKAGEESILSTHYHVPVSIPKFAGLNSTLHQEPDELWQLLASGKVKHLEVETYTFNVLPEELRSRGVVQCVTDELKYILQKLATDFAD